jgi:hypothetical protein
MDNTPPNKYIHMVPICHVPFGRRLADESWGSADDAREGFTKCLVGLQSPGIVGDESLSYAASAVVLRGKFHGLCSRLGLEEERRSISERGARVQAVLYQTHFTSSTSVTRLLPLSTSTYHHPIPIIMEYQPYMFAYAFQGPYQVAAVAPVTTNHATFDFVTTYPHNGSGTDTGTSTGTNTNASSSPSARSVSSSVTSHPSSSSEGPTKRGPGRPRKHPRPAPLPQGAQAPPKRGPGRPRKIRPVEENPLPKRGRGRPPKAKGTDGAVRTPEEQPISRPREVTTPANPVWSQSMNRGSSPVLEDLFLDLPPLQVPEMSDSPASSPWNATPTLESMELGRMWFPQRTMVPAAPPQPRIPRVDSPVIWRDWLVDDVVDSWDYWLLLKANRGFHRPGGFW